MKFAKGGLLSQPVYAEPADGFIPEESINIDNLRTALMLDVMLLELEESLENGTGRIVIGGRELERGLGAARRND